MDQKSPSPPPNKKQKCEPAPIKALKKLIKRTRSKSAVFVKKYPREPENAVNKTSKVKIISFEDIGTYSPTINSCVQLSSAEDNSSQNTVTSAPEVGTFKNLFVSFKERLNYFNLNSYLSVQLENQTDLFETQNTNLEVSMSTEDLEDSNEAFWTNKNRGSSSSLLNDCSALEPSYDVSSSRESLLSSASDQTLIFPTSNITSYEDNNKRAILIPNEEPIDSYNSNRSFFFNKWQEIQDHEKCRRDTLDSDFTLFDGLEDGLVSKQQSTNSSETFSHESLLSSVSDERLLFPTSNIIFYENNDEKDIPISIEEPIDSNNANRSSLLNKWREDQDHRNYVRRDTLGSDPALFESLKDLDDYLISKQQSTNSKETFSRDYLSSVSHQTLFLPVNNKTSFEDNNKRNIQISKKELADSSNFNKFPFFIKCQEDQDNGNYVRKNTLDSSDPTFFESLKALGSDFLISKTQATKSKATFPRESLSGSVSDQTLIFSESNKTFQEDNNQKEMSSISRKESIDSNDVIPSNEDLGNHKRKDTFGVDFATVESLRSLVNGCPISKSLSTTSKENLSRESVFSNFSDRTLTFRASNELPYEDIYQNEFMSTSTDPKDSDDALPTINEDHVNPKEGDNFFSDFASIESLRSLVNGCPISKSLAANNNVTSSDFASSNVSNQALIFPANNKTSYDFNQEGLFPHQVILFSNNTPETMISFNPLNHGNNLLIKNINSDTFEKKLADDIENQNIQLIQCEDTNENCSRIELDSGNKNQTNSCKFERDEPLTWQNISNFTEQDNVAFRKKLKSLKTVPSEIKPTELLNNACQATKPLLLQNNNLFPNDAPATLLEKTNSKILIQNGSKPTYHFNNVKSTESVSLEDNNFVSDTRTEFLENPRTFERTQIPIDKHNLTLRTEDRKGSNEIIEKNDTKNIASFESILTKSSRSSRLNGMGEGDQDSSKSQFLLNEDGLDRFGAFVTNQLRQLPLNSVINCENVIVELLVNERMKIITNQVIQEDGTSTSCHNPISKTRNQRIN